MQDPEDALLNSSDTLSNSPAHCMKREKEEEGCHASAQHMLTASLATRPSQLRLVHVQEGEAAGDVQRNEALLH